MPVIGSGVCSQIKLNEISNIITWPLQTGFKSVAKGQIKP